MTDAEYLLNIRRFRRAHWLHYVGQTLLAAGASLMGRGQIASLHAIDPQLATWPALLLLAVALPLLGVVLYGVCQSIKPNLRRPYAENMRLYQSRMVVRNSLLGLACLPVVAAYLLTHNLLDVVLYAGLLVFLSRATVPTAQKYQRWLLT